MADKITMAYLLHAARVLTTSLQDGGGDLSEPPRVQDRGGFPELANMFQKLVDYFSKYQNTYGKHDAVIVGKVEFVFELASSFMEHLIRLSKSALPRVCRRLDQSFDGPASNGRNQSDLGTR